MSYSIARNPLFFLSYLLFLWYRSLLKNDRIIKENVNGGGMSFLQPKKKIKKKSFFIFLFHLGIILLCGLSIFLCQKQESATVENLAWTIYEKPNLHSPRITQIPYGKKIKILKKLDYWYQISYQGKQGWVPSWIADTKEKPNTKEKTAYTMKKVALKENDYETSPTLTSLSKGEKVEILKEKWNWSFVKVNDDYGWISSSNLSELKYNTNPVQTEEQKNKVNPRILYVRQQNTKLRTKPSTKSESKQTLRAGAKVTVLKNKTDQWYYVQTASGEKGYIASWLLTTENLSHDNKRKNNLKGAVIVIDPGHGGQDAGSVSQDNRYEKDATLATSKCLEKELKKQGAKVIMTRNDDEYVSLEERTDISNKNEADAFICIHFDSTTSSNVASGTTTYYYHENSKGLANKINQQIKKLPLSNRGVQFGDYQVTRENNEPAVLLELGYMSTTKDEKYIFSKKYQQDIANAVTKGLLNYFSNQ